ncbi:hypothetical protein CHS0354_012474 [Potamilus streckersoni]|uniref:G-protein coupled receptors family 1 profile domain-containing protein n=1 Tax=Potamilus streckersoni TaxID=2493646 RepID=A0AAE0S090_9BIVA|nr:hypothetical protein CHS0354_012474 [Potamilus streckersoni]
MDQDVIIDNLSNISSDNTSGTSTSNSNNEDIKTYKLAATILAYILTVMITVLNGTVICVLLKSRKDRNRLHFFVLNMACADFLVGAVMMLGYAIENTVGQWLAGNIFCKVYQACSVLVTCGSNNILMALSVDRFLAIAMPLKFMKGGTKVHWALVSIAWGLTVPYIIMFILYCHVSLAGTCEINLPHNSWYKPYFDSVFAVQYLFPALVITFCYVGICVIIWRKWKHGLQLSGSAKDSTKFSKNPDLKSNRPQRERSVQGGLLPKAKVRSIKLTAIICAAFILCWTPYFLYNFLGVHELIAYKSGPTYFMQVLCPLNSVANPVAFIIFNTKMFGLWYKRTDASSISNSNMHQVTEYDTV